MESDSEPQRHRGADSRLAVEQFRQSLACHAETPGRRSNRNARRLEAQFADHFAGMRRIVHSHCRTPSMIVKVVNVECFAVFESKNDSPVSAYGHGPEARKPACQPMKAKTRQCRILNSYGGVQYAEDQPESLVVLRPDAGVASGIKEIAQSLMGKTANHETHCNP